MTHHVVCGEPLRGGNIVGHGDFESSPLQKEKSICSRYRPVEAREQRVATSFNPDKRRPSVDHFSRRLLLLCLLQQVARLVPSENPRYFESPVR